MANYEIRIQEKLRILITISHPAHANFFKEAAKILKKDGYEVFISVLERGKLIQIVDKEYTGFEKFRAGKHKGSLLSIIFSVNILRFFKLLKYSFFKHIDFGLSVGSFTLGAALKILSTPNVQFDDDPERKMNILLEKITANKIYFPHVIEPAGKIQVFNALKEWSNLSPKYFRPDISYLDEYNLKQKEYIVIRDISTGSMNYMKQNPDIILNFAKDLPKNMKIVLSLEDKTNFRKYPDDWIILHEPVADFYSLLYYSRLVISSGDSMAREAAMLGVPGIYCGFRKMKANEILKEKGLLFHSKPGEELNLINDIISGKIKYREQDDIRNELLDEWEDVTELIVNIVKSYDN
jgi:uncharacterized protein